MLQLRPGFDRAGPQARGKLHFVKAFGSVVFTLPLLLGADAPADPLDRLAGKDLTVSLRFERQPLTKVLMAIGASAGFKPELDPALDKVVVTVDAANVRVRELLTQLSREHALRLDVPAPDRLVVGPSARPAG